MLRVVLVCKLNDNTVNKRFKYQCSIDVKNTTFRAHTRHQVTRNQLSRAKRRQNSTDRKECKLRRDVALVRRREELRIESGEVAYCR